MQAVQKNGFIGSEDNPSPSGSEQKTTWETPVLGDTAQTRGREGKFASLSMKTVEEDLVRFFIELGNLRHYQGSLYFYRSRRGFWQRLAKADTALALRKYINEDCSQKIGARRMHQVINTMLELPELEADFSVQHEKLLNVTNGVVDLETLKVTPHDRSLRFTYCLNFCFIKSAVLEDAPTFLRYLQTSLEYDTMRKKTRCFLETIGYCVSSLRGARKAFFWIGKTSAGKSKFLQVIEHVVGEENVSNLALHDIAERFKTAKLLHARLNVSSEIRTSKLKNLDVWKDVVSGERITVETKGGHPFEFSPNVRMIFAGNELPKLAEADAENAVLSRIKVILFNFSIPRSEWDHELVEKLCMEKDVIFSLAVATLPGLIANHYIFARTADEEAFIENYVFEQNSAKEFFLSCCCFEKGARVHVRPLYDVYSAYCRDNAVEAVSESDFKRTILKEGVIPRKFRLNGSKPLAGYIGVRMKTIEELLGQDSVLDVQPPKQESVAE